MARSILVAGLFRSGTNYLQRLVDANLEVAPVDPALPKHAIKPHNLALLDGQDVVVIHKPLPKWIDSMCRQSFDFIDHYDVRWQRFHTPVEIDYFGLPIPVSLEKLCEHYARFHRQWMQRDAVFVKHKTAAFNPVRTLCRLSDRFGVRRVTPFTPITVVPNSGPFDTRLYVGENYTNLLPEHLEVIHHCKDKEVEDYLYGTPEQAA